MTTPTYPSVTDELIAELDREVLFAEETGYPAIVESPLLAALLAERARLIKDAARLEWLAENMRMEFGSGEIAQWSFDGLPHVVSDREGCLVRDLRDFIDQQRMIENDQSA